MEGLTLVHPDPVVRWIEQGRPDPPEPGIFDMTDHELDGMSVNGRPVPGWWRLMPAVVGGYDPYGTRPWR